MLYACTIWVGSSNRTLCIATCTTRPSDTCHFNLKISFYVGHKNRQERYGKISDSVLKF